MCYKISSKIKPINVLVFRIQPNKNISLTSHFEGALGSVSKCLAGEGRSHGRRRTGSPPGNPHCTAILMSSGDGRGVGAMGDSRPGQASGVAA